MDQELRKIHQQLLLIVIGSFALVPFFGYGIAAYFGMVSVSQLLAWPVGPSLILLYLGLLLWMTHHFRRLLLPLVKRQQNDVDASDLTQVLGQNLQGYADSYWSFFLLYVLIIPTVQHWYGVYTSDSSAYVSLLQFILLQLVVAILFGMPGYLYSLSLLGRSTEYAGLSQIHISMKSKMLLIGGYIPLLGTAILVKYYWWQTGFLSTDIVVAWGLMGLIAFTVTFLAIRSLNQSLEPVQEVISSSGASNYLDLSRRMRPRSIDEIGYLIQTLGKVSRRTGITHACHRRQCSGRYHCGESGR